MPVSMSRSLWVVVGVILFLGCNVPRGEAKGLRLASTEKFQWVTREIAAPHLQYQTFESKAAKSKVSYHIYTPKAYDTATSQRFPVLYWLHGTGGGLRGVKKIANYFDAAIEEGKIRPMLVVFPNGPKSMWCDSKDGRVPMETMLIKELLPHVDATFGTIASRDGRLIEGFSMGGYGAARLGFKYPDIFGAVSSLSGGPLQREFTTSPRTTERMRQHILETTYGDHAYFIAQSPWMLALKNANQIRGRVHLRQVIGGKDAMLRIQHEFDDHLTSLKIPHAFIVLPDVDHNPMEVLNALGEDNWEFYRTVFGSPGARE